ncbi:hypothetical protein M5X00_32075 [Paenibacillus alvei]|uniref:Phage protein n=1 Tax=Paenibacillus alvei TaxID=44250 RepID=A0ABT4GWW8_PAEAL|nr:hypothetical protein [Paenibacillus alvei]MCY9541819.1 hypothetical protein [Paenibacillus alvei]MCY9704993.1 hypothetical protein [Paenibacillus alvei]MCY9758856.1 hypothetical protein [Paenibacillus alvei]MCY9761205.1 hypothetical protein [Paenibacillus alvei]MCY9765751.1 hypothetical protein [Paenibacillus alvei]
MTEQEIKEFTAALAARYVQVKEEYSWTSTRFSSLNVANMSRQELDAAYVKAERAFAKWVLFTEVIDSLPLDIRRAFLKECELLKSE